MTSLTLSEEEGLKLDTSIYPSIRISTKFLSKSQKHKA